MVTRRKNVAWDSDRAHSEGQTSLEVLLAWLADPFNYVRWRGGVVTKEDLCSEVNSALRGERIHHRKNLDVRVKIMKLEKTFAVANQWLMDTGLYDSVMRGECSADVKANLQKLCRYYDILAPGMRDTIMASSSSEPASAPKGPHVVPAASSPPKEKAVKKAPVAKTTVKPVAKATAKPVVKPVSAEATDSDVSDEDESSDSNDGEPEQKIDKKKASVVVNVPAAKLTKPDTVNDSSDSEDDSSSSSSTGEEVEIPAAQEEPADTSDTSSDEDEASEKESQSVVVPSAEEVVGHEEVESEEEDSEEEKEPVKATARASPNGSVNGKRQHGAADAQAVKLVTPLMASQRIAIPTASPAPKQLDSETKESPQEDLTHAAVSKDLVQATSLRHLRVLHRLDVEDRREKRKRQRTLYELEHQKLLAELETKQMQRDLEKMNLEVARALARQKLLAAGVSQQQVDRALAK